MQCRFQTLMIALGLGPPTLALLWPWPSPGVESVFVVMLVATLFGLLIVPIWAGVRRAELLKQRRAKRKHSA